MPSRRNRRLLFEVAGRAPARPAVRVAPRASIPLRAASGDRPASAGNVGAEAERPAGQRWQRPEVWAVVAALVVVAVVAFYAGRRYERFASMQRPGEVVSSDAAAERAPADEPLEPRSTPAAQPEPPQTGPQAAPAARRTARPAVPPRVELKPGYGYIVVQHFPLKRRKDAEAAVRFLLDAGVPAALLRGADYRVIVTEPFDTLNADRSVARREQQRASRMQARIRELGREFNRLRGYSFKDCYLLTIR